MDNIFKRDDAGRNDPCPCGSGKKYKHCCQKNNVIPFPQPNPEQQKEVFFRDFFEYLFKKHADQLLQIWHDFEFEDTDDLEELLEDDDFQLLIQAYGFQRGSGGTEGHLSRFVSQRRKNYSLQMVNVALTYQDTYYSCYKLAQTKEGIYLFHDLMVEGEIYPVKFDIAIDESVHGEIVFCRLVQEGDYWQVLSMDELTMDESREFLARWTDLLAPLSPVEQKTYLIDNSLQVFIDFMDYLGEISIDDCLDEDDYLDDDIYLLALAWLREFHQKLGCTPLEAFHHWQKSTKLKELLQNFHKLDLPDEERDVRELLLPVIMEQLGLGETEINAPSDWSWAKESYEMVAQFLVQENKNFHPPLELYRAIALWHDYTETERPQFKKPWIWVAALDYVLQERQLLKPTFTQLAAEYQVTAQSISKSYKSLEEAVDLDKWVPMLGDQDF